MSEQRTSPFTKPAVAAAPSVPPTRAPSTDPSDAPMRILLNWAILCGALVAILAFGGLFL